MALLESRAMQMPRNRILLLSAVFAALGVVIFLAMQRELMPRVTNARPPIGNGALQQNALSAVEEAYAAALWPIHSEVVEASAVALSFAGVDYIIEHHDARRLEAKVLPLHALFRGAAVKARALEVPVSMELVHGQYLEALSLFENASAEMVKVAEDGRVEHLIEAQDMSQRASEDLLKVGDVLWPGEHKPN